eukprot:10471277-Ditylum_brightwellii.AAC.1
MDGCLTPSAIGMGQAGQAAGDCNQANTVFRGGAGETPNYFKAMMPMDTPVLEAERNQRKLKHVMLGKMIWDSLTSNFQIELMAEETNFKH